MCAQESLPKYKKCDLFMNNEIRRTVTYLPSLFSIVCLDI